MNITALLYNAVRRFRGVEPEDSNGAAGLAPYMGLTSTSLSHKVSPTYASAHCSPDEVVMICKLTQDHAPLQAMAMQLGYALLPIAPATGDGDPDYVQRMSSSVAEFGQFIAEASSSYADRSIDDNEMARITQEFAESMSAQAHLFALLKAKHLKAKPAAALSVNDVRWMKEQGEVVA
ncbi:phage regulatory CII family protein [uncultured Xylophilus sp.]|uniref:phage regulatory CII family protein n=1 Tax=uncultured Xylophilus sp. TaxID=296832 RepID=UPI0025EB44D8|nr:phage regulatory CII family protein [uncultured Xylophilus sp.]